MKTLLAIPGSIRTGSYNKAVCRALTKLAPEDTTVKVYELDDLPMFSADLEDNLPAEVKSYIQQVEAADGVIFSTPEYNNMVPGVLKNACEWLTRSYSEAAVEGKPVAITGATTGSFGTVRAQNQLMTLATIMGFEVDASQRLPLSRAQSLFDEEGQLQDDKVRDKLRRFVATLAART